MTGVGQEGGFQFAEKAVSIKEITRMDKIYSILIMMCWKYY